MACLVVGCDLFLMLGDHPALLLCADADLDEGTVDIFLLNKASSGFRCVDGGLVHEILKIRSGEACSGLSHLFEVHIISQRFAFAMNFQDLLTASDIRTANAHFPIKTAGTEDCRIQNIHTVGCCHDDDASL